MSSSSRTYATARSFEVDALLVVGAAPAADAVPGVDARAAQPTPDAAAPTDPRIALLIAEVWRHSKALGAFGDAGLGALKAAGVARDSAGVITGDDVNRPEGVLTDMAELLTLHRVWERFAPTGR